jgi:hypothetical protein
VLTKDEALERVWRYFNQHGISEKRQPCSVRLITRSDLHNDANFEKLKHTRPDVYHLVLSEFRDNWSVFFETGVRSPPHIIVEVDAETGEVRLPDIL